MSFNYDNVNNDKKIEIMKLDRQIKQIIMIIVSLFIR